MDPPLSGFVLDPSKCCNLTVKEKGELIRELSNRPESAPDMLQTWSRRDLIEILCAEMGKERKYTGLTKQKLIDHLFKVVSAKNPVEHLKERDPNPHPPPPPPGPQNPSKRQRKMEQPSRLPVTQIRTDAQTTTRYCLNLACKSTLNQDDPFCKRCSCCICHKFDDNKDPSLWLVCSSETSSECDPCGLSCHLECALKNGKAGISENGQCKRLDGSYYCIDCGKVNDLLRCWRKQLNVAKDARRVDVLCYRVSLSHRLLRLSSKYKSLHEIVDEAMKKLESEVGPLNGLPNMARGLVNRLSVGSEVQKLCSLALEKFNSIPCSPSPVDAQIFANSIKFEAIAPTSVTVVLRSEDPSLASESTGFALWHRRADTTDYPLEPTFVFSKAKRGAPVTDLTPATEYMFKVTTINNSRESGNWEVGVKTEPELKGVTTSLVAEGTRATQCCSLSDPSSDENNTYRKMNKTPEALDTGKPSDDQTDSNSDGQDETPGNSTSALDEEPNSTVRDPTVSPEFNHALDTPKPDNKINPSVVNKMGIVPYATSESAVPATPCRLETIKEGSGRSSRPPDDGLKMKEPSSSTKKKLDAKFEEAGTKDGSSGGKYEYCVKVIRWLECEGHIETAFRVKFLTWFSLHATSQERRVVNVYVDNFIDDHVSLAAQLVDTFSETVYGKRPPPVQTGFCMRLWH